MTASQAHPHAPPAGSVPPQAPKAEPADFARFAATRFFDNLNGVRCLAILAVVWHHARGSELYRLSPDLPGPLLNFAGRGFLGVDMFFAISGFLIVTLLLRERDRTGGIDLKKFYIRRSLRIFPVYYAFVLGVTAVYALLKPGSETTGQIFASLPTVLLYLSNVWVPTAGIFLVTWSLATEEQFYLLWAPVERWVPRALLWGGLTLIIVLSLVTHTGVFDPTILSWYAGTGAEHRGSVHLPEVFGTTLLPIAGGVVLAHAMHRPDTFRWVARLTAFRGAPLLYAASLLALVALHGGDLRGWSRPAMQVLMLALLAALLLRDRPGDSPLSQALQWRVLARIGVVSYGIYLFHIPVASVVNPLTARYLEGLTMVAVAFLVTAALTWGVAELSFRFFEQPILRFKKRFEVRAV